jgi:hypothetical protein
VGAVLLLLLVQQAAAAASKKRREERGIAIQDNFAAADKHRRTGLRGSDGEDEGEQGIERGTAGC